MLEAADLLREESLNKSLFKSDYEKYGKQKVNITEDDIKNAKSLYNIMKQ